MEDAQLLVTIFGSMGGGAAVLAFINGMFKWLSGASSREREKRTSLQTQRTDAVERAEEAERKEDLADIKRRQAEEHVAILKSQLREAGIQPLPRPKFDEE